MKVLLWINRVLLTVLSLMTASVKLASMEEEMLLFRGVGFPDAATWLLGAIQLIGGLLLLVPRTTHIGAWVMAPTFAIASGVVFLDGMLSFGIASLLFIGMAVWHALRWPRDTELVPVH